MANGQKISPILTDDASVEDLGPGGLLNELPSLKETADRQRKFNTKFNDYADLSGNRYSSVHPDATSDGDNAGRGDAGNGVGTNNDQMELKKLLYSSGNKYKPGSGYFNIDYIQEYW
tara:strand:+ start:13727 stop:14077 length:351 start_codon:yes stop_codon:yes gene_type:complete